MANASHIEEWRKSSRSGTTGCVEVAVRGAEILVRDSKDTSGPKLRFGRASWKEFLRTLDEQKD